MIMKVIVVVMVILVTTTTMLMIITISKLQTWNMGARLWSEMQGNYSLIASFLVDQYDPVILLHPTIYM